MLMSPASSESLRNGSRFWPGATELVKIWQIGMSIDSSSSFRHEASNMLALDSLCQDWLPRPALLD